MSKFNEILKENLKYWIEVLTVLLLGSTVLSFLIWLVPWTVGAEEINWRFVFMPLNISLFIFGLSFTAATVKSVFVYLKHYKHQNE